MRLVNKNISKLQVSIVLDELNYALKSLDLKTKLSRHNFSQQRTDKFVFLSCRLGNTWHLNFDFKFQVFLSHNYRKTNSPVFLGGRSYGSTILFQDLLTFSFQQDFCFWFSTYFQYHWLLSNALLFRQSQSHFWLVPLDIK